MKAKEIMALSEPKVPFAKLGDFEATRDWRAKNPARYTAPTGRFTIPRRSLRGLRQLPRKEKAVIRKALKDRLRERFCLSPSGRRA